MSSILSGKYSSISALLALDLGYISPAPTRDTIFESDANYDSVYWIQIYENQKSLFETIPPRWNTLILGA